MSRLNIYQFLVLIVVLLILSGICVGGGISIWYYVNQYLLPLQPQPQGVFPQTPIWTYESEDRILSTPAISDSLAIFRTLNMIIAFDVQNSEKIWESESYAPFGLSTGNLTISPLIADNLVLVPEKGSTLAAYSLLTGERQWVSQQIQNYHPDMKLHEIEDYVIKQNKVYVARSSRSLSAYDLQYGDLIWEIEVPNRAILDVEADSKCVYLSANESLTCYDPGTGEKIWKRELNTLIGRIVLDNNSLYIILPFGSTALGSLDLDTLVWNWVIDKSKFPGDELRTLAVADDYLYVGGNHRLYKISKTDGEIIWKSEDTGWLETPVVINSKVIVRNTGSDLYAFDANTGEQIGSVKVKHNTSMRRDPERSPAVWENLLILPFGDNRIFAYQLNE